MEAGNVVALAGDWHGDRLFAKARIQGLGMRDIKTLFHLGDFGIWPGPNGKRYLTEVEAVCAEYGVTIYVTPGNHEDWGRLLSKKAETRGSLGPLLWLTDHVAVFPRDPAGHRFEFGGRSFVSLGGAPSLDFQWRTQGQTWWPEEQIPTETAERVAAGGYADVMLTHDAPGAPWQTRRVAAIVNSNPMGWTDTALAYAAEGRSRMTLAFEGVKPRFLAHGHFHVRDEMAVPLPGCDYDTTIVSLAAAPDARNMALLDLGLLKIVPMPPL